MTIDEIPVKSDKIAITDKLYLLSADEFNALVDMVRLLRSEVIKGGTMYNIYLKNNLPSQTIAVQEGMPARLEFTFVSQSRESITDEYQNTGERGRCEVWVNTSPGTDGSEYVLVHTVMIPSGSVVGLDVSSYITSGSNLVRLVVTGEMTNQETEPLPYSVQRTNLGVSIPTFQWWKPQVSSTVEIPMFIQGNSSKILWVTVTGNDYEETYKYPLGTTTYVDVAYNCKINHPGISGVYTIEYHLSDVDGIVNTTPQTIDVIFVNVGDTGRYIAVNRIIEKAINWSSNDLFHYTIYDGNEESCYVEFDVEKDGLSVYNQVIENVKTGSNINSAHVFEYSMEIDHSSNDDFDIVVKIKDEEGNIDDAIDILVDNQYSFGATAGAVFYLNPRVRSNSQSNYLKVINSVDNSEIDVAWTNMNWGNDGWTTDKGGNKILRLFAGSQAVIDYKPFHVEFGDAEIATTGKTIELDFLVDNVSGYDNTITDISTKQTLEIGETFIGLRVLPEQVTLFSNVMKGLSYDENGNLLTDGLQGINVCEGERTRVTITIVPQAYGYGNAFNLAVIYVNGVKNREFVYPINDVFSHSAPITIGSDYADIDVYGIRVYDYGLPANAVQLNYINWLATRDEKSEIFNKNDLYNGNDISYDLVKPLYNCFVIEMNDGADIPSIDNEADDLKCTLDVHYAEHPDWDFTVQNAPIGGQGTSSMKYRKWNLRWKFKNSTMIYADGSETTVGKTVRFTKDETKPKFSTRLTAKKNFASSMHSHKMGSVAAFNDLWNYLGMTNKAGARVCVYQYPFVGFQKTTDSEGTVKYTFIGLYTMGPDKGDDLCFGYDTDKYPNLLSIEGSDNAPLFALFRVPWNPNKSYMAYNPGDNAEAYLYNGKNSWDYDAGSPASDEVSEVADVEALYKLQWLDPYNFAYSCSDRLLPFEGTAELLNSAVDTYRDQPYEFWVTGGDVYYYESAEGMFIPSDCGQGVINLYNQLVDKGYGLVSADVEGKTVNELNELFKQARIQKFRQEVEYYFDINDAIFHRNWVEFNAATDNRAKNTYPYIFDVIDVTTNEGDKWRWRGDDMDTIWPITNQGLSRKGYYVETHDTYADGGAVWNGETSVFWNLVDAAFPKEINQAMTNFMKAMESLGGLASNSSSFDRIYAFFDKYYFLQAQEYFPMTLYNADAKWTYEDAKWAEMNDKYKNDTDPITQSMGDHYQAEKRWIRKRILYMMSKYSYGTFGASSSDRISVRAAGNTLSSDLIPAIDMYPTITDGTSVTRGPRTKAGEVCTMSINLGGTGDQQYDILAASYMLDIGDWYDKNIKSITVNGKMLRELRIGNENADIVTCPIQTLSVGACTSLTKIELRNLSQLSGELRLPLCTHLQEIYAGGTLLSKIVFPEGGALKNILYGSLNLYLTLINFPQLTSEGVDISNCIRNITDFLVQDCPKLNPLDLLVKILDAQAEQGDSHSLKYVRATGFELEYDNSLILDKIAVLADGTYAGMNSDGSVGGSENRYPVLIGKITLNGNYVQSIVNVLNESFPNLELVLNGIAVLEFNDDEFKRIALILWDADGDGDITPEEGQVEKMVQDQFKNNANLIEADFSSLNFYIRYNNAQTFVGSTNLKKVTYGEYGGFGAATFSGCSSLETVVFPEDITNYKLGDQGEFVNFSAAFQNCISLKEVVLPKQWNYLSTNINNCFRGCTSLEYLDVPENFDAAFANGFSYFVAGCSNLKTLILRPISYTVFYQNCCNGATALESLIIFNPTPANVQGGGLPTNGTCVIYVPDESVNAYKTASGWLAHADRIKGISEYPGTL